MASKDREATGPEKAAISESPAALYEAEDSEEYEMDEKEMKRILRKIDWKIVPYSALL